MINELIDQIGGRDGVEDMAEGNWPDSGFYDNIKLMARALLAVLDAKPVAVVDIQRGRGDGKKFALCYTSAGHSLPDDVYNLYTTPPAASVTYALCEAVNAIYFNDSSDYLSALWSVVRALSPETADLFAKDERAAFEMVNANIKHAAAPAPGGEQ